MNPFRKPKKPVNPMTQRIHKLKRRARFFQIKLFLFITLPVAIAAIGRAVLKEFIKIRVRQAAESAKDETIERLKKDSGAELT